jgi:adenosylcobinamide-phosphate synthase
VVSLEAQRAVLARRAGAAAAALLIDRVLGEPPSVLHPVAAFGRAMSALEARTYRPTRTAGVVHAGAGVATGAAAGLALRSTALATYLAVAARALADAARAVERPLAAGDLPGARAALPALVGRDPSRLDTSEISRAVVESIAENTVDAVVAPTIWAVAGGAPAVLAYRAANTLDAMVGHRSSRYERFGWAGARLDDLANLVPARLTAALVAAVRPSRAPAVLATVRRDAAQHPSPNAGVAEAAFAAALGVRLGGANRYGERIEDRGTLGDGRCAAPGDIDRAVRLLDDIVLALGVGLLALASLAATLGAPRPARRSGAA